MKRVRDHPRGYIDRSEAVADRLRGVELSSGEVARLFGELANPTKPVIEAKERVDDLLSEVEHLLTAVNGPVFHGLITNQKVGDLLRDA